MYCFVLEVSAAVGSGGAADGQDLEARGWETAQVAHYGPLSCVFTYFAGSLLAHLAHYTVFLMLCLYVLFCPGGFSGWCSWDDRHL